MSFTFSNGENHIFGTRSGGNETITLKAAYGQQLSIEDASITGTWNGSVITGTYGGTGVNNGARTITTTDSITIGSTATPNQLVIISSSNNLSGLATANNGVLITSAGGVPSISSTLPSAVQGNITSVGTIGSGTWSGTNISLGKGGTGSSLSATNGSVICVSGGTGAQTAAGTTGQLLLSAGTSTPTWSNTIPNAMSITNATASTSTSTGSLINSGGFGNAGTIYAGGNVYCPNVVNSSVVYSTTNNTLTSASPYNIIINGGGGFWTKLPDTTTLAAGQSYRILNNTGGSVILQTSAGSAITTTFDKVLIATCINNSSNVVASWSVDLPNMNYCTVYTSAAISIPHNTSTNPFTISAGTVSQSGSVVSGTTGGVITINETGMYLISGNASWSNPSSLAGWRSISFVVSNVVHGYAIFPFQSYDSATTTNGQDQSGCIVLPITAGNTIYLRALQTSGSSVSMSYLISLTVARIIN